MVKKQQSKRQRNIKSKLMAAICMLLVSTIMMVSSTYAWFTLSTAPEVTGITTAVGANGNLEMALVPEDGLVGSIKSEVGKSMAATDSAKASNITWGNLVDLKDTATYGLNNIKLLPAALNVTAGKLVADGALLKTPTYGADGRVDELLANTYTGVYTDGGFKPDGKFGVRAVGTASGMTERQLDYRNSASAASTAMSQAKNELVTSLTTNGSGLANIAIKRGMGSDTDGYTAEEILPLEKALDSLDTVLGYIDRAYMQYILTYAAGGTFTEDTVWTGVKALVEANGATLSSVRTGLSAAGMTDISALEDFFETYDDLAAAVDTAQSVMTTMKNDKTAPYAWADFDDALTAIMNTSTITVNGFTISQVKEDPNLLVKDFLAKRSLTMTMGSGSGVYADIADQVGNYQASIVMDVKYGELLNLEGVPATMKTDSKITPYVSQFGAVAKSVDAPASAANSNPISDFYGFVIDLAFRTNAANSNLMLQVDATDRIYNDNTNDQTMGHGSSMTFKATDTSFTNEQMLGLMDAIRVIFFDREGNIVKRAKLDTTTGRYTVGTEGITAKLSLCTEIGDVTYEYDRDDTAGTYKKVVKTNYVQIAEGETGTHAWDNESGTYVESTDGGFKAVTTTTYEPIVEGDGTTEKYVQREVKSETATLLTDRTIMPLNQNVAHGLSVLVYLDGNKMDNGDVATGATSMTGTMNLQFSSDANLIPMEYAALHQGTGSGNNEQSGGENP